MSTSKRHQVLVLSSHILLAAVTFQVILQISEYQQAASHHLEVGWAVAEHPKCRTSILTAHKPGALTNPCMWNLTKSYHNPSKGHREMLLITSCSLNEVIQIESLSQTMEGCLWLTHKSAAQFEVKCEFKVQNNSIFRQTSTQWRGKWRTFLVLFITFDHHDSFPFPCLRKWCWTNSRCLS